MSKSGNLAALAAILEATDSPTLYYAEDPPYLPRVLVFYWPVQTVGSTSAASRIRTTVLSAAGFKSFGAFQVSPSSSYYSAVHKLPEDKQRDEVSRGLAFSLFRYFSELSPAVKTAITDEHVQHGIGLKWGQTHAAQIACRLGKVHNPHEVVEALRPFAKRPAAPQSPQDVRNIVPQTSIRKTRPSFLPPDASSGSIPNLGQFTPSRRTPLPERRRTPSRTMATPRKSPPVEQKPQTAAQMEALRFQMCEFVDTEDRYISKLQDLTQLVVTQGRTPKSLGSRFQSSKDQDSINAMIQFPSLLDEILELNAAFLDDVRDILDKTDESAMACFGPGIDVSHMKDPLGSLSFAKALLNHFPKFLVPYREYLDVHSKISSNLSNYLKEGTFSIQQAPSLLMEPAQRISRYSLYIDAMTPNLGPTSSLTAKTLDKARKIIAEICDMEPAASTILDSLRIEHEDTRSYRPLSPQKLFNGLRSNGTIKEAAPVTLKESTPRLMPSMSSMSRSFSRKAKTMPSPPKLHLGERSINRAPDENSRPSTRGSDAFSKGSGRPGTGSSLLSVEERPSSREHALKQLYQGKIEILEQENAELKRALRECRCGVGERGAVGRFRTYS